MSTFVLIHGAGDGGWSWHLVEAELRARGHDVVAPDLPAGDESLMLDDYAAAVIAAVGQRRDLIVVAHSFGGFTAPLVATRLPVDALVFVAGMVPAPGEAPRDWWGNTGFKEAVEAQAARDGGVTGNDDPYIAFYHDVSRELARQALSKARKHPSEACMNAPWPLEALPDVPTHFVLATEDRFFPSDYLQSVAIERLGVFPEVIAAGHCVALSRPTELADLLDGYSKRVPPRLRIAGHYDAELRSHHKRLLTAMDVRRTDHVLDVGCGTGQSSRAAARKATSGHVLGIDISQAMVQRARELAATEGISNISFELGDAGAHAFTDARFDLIISRFGTMFFADPVAAFTNIARAARPGARLVMMVWQGEAQNEWATAIRDLLTGIKTLTPAKGLDPFSLADPDVIRSLLDSAGFVDVDIVDVHKPVYYGENAAGAFDLVRDMQNVRDTLAQVDAASAERVLGSLRDLLTQHENVAGVLFDSRAWLVTANRAGM